MCLNKLIDKTSNEIKLQIKNVATCKNTSIYIVPFKKVQIFACIILYVLQVVSTIHVNPPQIAFVFLSMNIFKLSFFELRIRNFEKCY